MSTRSTIQDALAAYEAEFEFARSILLPVEDQVRFGIPRQAIGYRWFESPNVIDLEKVRRLKSAGRLG